MTTNKRVTSKAKALARDNAALSALSAHFTGTETLTLDGTSVKVKDLRQQINDRIDATAAADAAQATWHTAVATANERNLAMSATMVALRQHILSEYGAKSQVAVDFGFITKREPPTAETTAAAVLRRRAIRAAKKTAVANALAQLDGAPAPQSPATQAQPSSTQKPTS